MVYPIFLESSPGICIAKEKVGFFFSLTLLRVCQNRRKGIDHQAGRLNIHVVDVHVIDG